MNSSRCHPVPMPRSIRPRDRTSSVATVLATSNAGRAGADEDAGAEPDPARDRGERGEDAQRLRPRLLGRRTGTWRRTGSGRCAGRSRGGRSSPAGRSRRRRRRAPRRPAPRGRRRRAVTAPRSSPRSAWIPPPLPVSHLRRRALGPGSDVRRPPAVRAVLTLAWIAGVRILGGRHAGSAGREGRAHHRRGQRHGALRRGAVRGRGGTDRRRRLRRGARRRSRRRDRGARAARPRS